MSYTKGGTGAGVILVISSTAATVSSPVAAPSAPPTALTVAPTSSPTGIAILQMKEFTLPSQKLAFDELTNSGSPANVAGTVTKEFVPTVLDPGELTCTGVFIPSDAGLAAVQTAFATGLANQFQVQLQPIAGQTTTGNVYDFNAIVSELPIPTSLTPEKAVLVKISLKLTSIVTVKSGS